MFFEKLNKTHLENKSKKRHLKRKSANRNTVDSKSSHTTLSTLVAIVGVGGNFLLGLGEELVGGNFLLIGGVVFKLLAICSVLSVS